MKTPRIHNGWKCWLSALCVLLLAAPANAAGLVHAHVQTTKARVPLTLELAATKQERAQGLMFRHDIGAYDGMLFAFPRPQEAAFWMKNTYIPLDIVFLDAQGRVLHIAPRTTPESLTPIPCPSPFLTAIELKAGHAAKAGIRPGDSVHFTLPEGSHVE